VKKRIHTYYKGFLECQYAFVERKLLGKRDQQYQHNIELQPRFRFHEVVEISEQEYLSGTETIASPFIRHAREERAELLKSPLSAKPISCPVDEIVMIMHNPDGVNAVPGPADGDGIQHLPPETQPLDWDGSELSGTYKSYKSEFEKAEHSGRIKAWDSVLQDVHEILSKNTPLPLNPFITQKGIDYFGRFHGFAYCRAYTQIEVPDPVVPPIAPMAAQTALPVLPKTQCKFIKPDAEQCSRMVDAGNVFCFQHRDNLPISGTPATDDGSCFGKKNPLNNNTNSQGNDGCFSKLPGRAGPMASGCFKGMGCFSPILQWLAAIAALLIGIALLALAWCFIFGDCGKGRNRSGNVGKQDTVYVEVFRELKDTLKIVKMDTVAYVDSTIKSKYEMVSLPNVQFYTDSDILLPSSARELQQLAEYLAKNEAVNATIIGHTDNTGDPQQNLDLSKRRAESVKRFLQSLGVNGNRLQSQGMGDKRPKADNNTKEGRLMNRRVEVQLITKESSETKRTQVPRKEGETAP